MADTARRLRIAEDLPVDDSAATQTIGILARKGGGKTYLASKIVEELHRLECPIVVIDPVGNWWGVTVAANGKDPGLSFVVLGGERGDIELTPEGGAVVAELVMARNLNVVLDVSSFSKTNMRRFVADFCERFFELAKRRRQARMVVFEEAQRFAPQQFKGQERMLGAVEDIVRLGRNYGLGCILISQRPQSVNKEVLSQVECLFVGQLNEAHARKALLAWIVEKDEDLKSRLGELTTLGRGEFYCWSPSWLRTFKRIKILPKWTFDASSTPKIGEVANDVGPPVGRLSAAELEGLREAMQADDEPRVAKGQSVALEQERRLRAEAEWRAEKLAGELKVVELLYERIRETVRALHAFVEQLPPPSSPKPEPDPAPPPAPSEWIAAPKAAKGQEGIGKCPRAILTVLVQQGRPLSKPRLALMAGYSANSGGFNNALSELRTKGWLEGTGGALSATAAGSKALGSVPPLPKGSELFAYWHNHPRVDKCARAILLALRSKRQLDKNALAVVTSYSANSGGFNNSLSKLRTLGLIEGRGEVTLAADLR